MIAVRKAGMLPLKDEKFACCALQAVGSFKREKHIKVIFLTPYKSHKHSNCVPGRHVNVAVQMPCIGFKM